MDDSAVHADFESFVRRNWSTLMSMAMTVSGSRGEAEDLVQTALTNAYARWRRVRPDDALAYLRRSILNANVSRWRRHRGAELSVAEPPEVPGAAVAAAAAAAEQAVDDRSTLIPLLRELPQRQRAVLILRYLCDLSDADIAATLGISVGTVRSQASRGLANLRSRHRSQLDQEGVPT